MLGGIDAPGVLRRALQVAQERCCQIVQWWGSAARSASDIAAAALDVPATTTQLLGQCHRKASVLGLWHFPSRLQGHDHSREADPHLAPSTTAMILARA